ncbi:MAG: HAMP domain-containing sensor histidine kinase [Planctomycetota bacterium]
MRSRSLRRGLLLWFVGLAGFLLLAFSLALWIGVRQSLLQGIDAELLARADSLVRLCEWEDGDVRLDLPEDPAALVGLTASRAEIWRWPAGVLLQRFGAPIAGSPNATLELPAVGATAFAAATLAAPASDRIGTLIAHRAAVAATSGEPARPSFAVLVRVARDQQPILAQLRAIGWLVLALTGVAIGLAVAFGAFLSRRIARPLQQLGAAAARASAGGSPAMPRRGTGDEIDRLAAALEGSFRSLQAAVDRQRRFTADASHELRNPLAALQSTAEVALRRERDGADYAAALRTVQQLGARMSRMLEALLLLARLDAGAPAGDFGPVDLAASARAAASAGAGRVTVSGAATVRGHDDLLRIAIGNLVDNALRYGAGAVQITITVAADVVELRVRDDGPGLAEDERRHVFERFHRGTGSAGTEGSGLGLAIVDAIAGAHGGSCAFESGSPGACVVLRLPHRLPPSDHVSQAS